MLEQINNNQSFLWYKLVDLWGKDDPFAVFFLERPLYNLYRLFAVYKTRYFLDFLIYYWG